MVDCLVTGRDWIIDTIRYIRLRGRNLETIVHLGLSLYQDAFQAIGCSTQGGLGCRNIRGSGCSNLGIGSHEALHLTKLGYYALQLYVGGIIIGIALGQSRESGGYITFGINHAWLLGAGCGRIGVGTVNNTHRIGTCILLTQVQDLAADYCRNSSNRSISRLNGANYISCGCRVVIIIATGRERAKTGHQQHHTC